MQFILKKKKKINIDKSYLFDNGFKPSYFLK